MIRVILFRLTSGLLLTALAVVAQAAVVSQVTDTVKGRAPVVAPTITGTAAVGQTLTVVKGFSDADGDAEMGSAVQWLDSGSVLAGQTAATLALNFTGVGGNLISVRVTPATDASITDPTVGTAATSAQTRVAPGPIFARFVRPDTTNRNWSNADNHCRALGARLPTMSELQLLFIEATTLTSISNNTFNYEMCDVHGWPLHRRCGGLLGFYWSSTPGSAGRHFRVSLENYAVYDELDSGGFSVACIR